MLGLSLLAVVAAVLIAIGCTRDSDDSAPPTSSVSFVSNVQGVSGEVVVVSTLGGVRYELELRGLSEGTHQAVLRGGTCESPTEPAERLGPLFVGETGETGLGVPRERPADPGGEHIAVLDPSGMLVACAPLGGSSD